MRRVLMSRTLMRVLIAVAMVNGLILSAPLARVALAQNVFNVTYFDTSDHDNTVRIANPTSHNTAAIAPNGHGGLCADIYVFDSHEEMNECCSCPVTNNGLLTLSVEDDLTNNTPRRAPAPTTNL